MINDFYLRMLLHNCLLYKGGKRAEIYQERCGHSDNGRVKTWLPYRSDGATDLLHDVTRERLLGDQTDKYYVSWYQVSTI